MTIKYLKPYLFNGFVLTIPILVWNIVWARKLPQAFQPDIFWDNIPTVISLGENISRILVFVLAGLMPIPMTGTMKTKGWALYWMGVALYFGAWLALIYFPKSLWSRSALGFMAPAYTPLFWLLGIGQMGQTYYFNLPFRRWFFVSVSFAFLVFHNLHTYMVFQKIH